MKILESIDKILASFGNIKAMKRTHVDTFTENEMLQISGEKIAERNNNGGIWIEFQELAGFDFMNVTVLSDLNIKTIKGCKLIFLGGTQELIINSDTTEIKSVYSNVSNRWMTEITFNVTKGDMQFIMSKDYSKIELTFKNKSILFNTIK